MATVPPISSDDTEPLRLVAVDSVTDAFRDVDSFFVSDTGDDSPRSAWAEAWANASQQGDLP